jgi:predicted HD phosphohydrolase
MKIVDDIIQLFQRRGIMVYHGEAVSERARECSRAGQKPGVQVNCVE